MKTRGPKPRWTIREASSDDTTQIERLIGVSVRALQSAYYSTAQIEAAFGPAYGVDGALIRDRSFFVIESESAIVACGGWSRRRAFFGGDGAHQSAEELLDPRADPARLRAFFVHPDWARQGLGRALVLHCEAAICAAGFARVELVATLSGEPLYASCGYAECERYAVPLRDGIELPVVRMRKTLIA